MTESIVTDVENWRYSEYLMPCSYNGHICDKKQLKTHPAGGYLCTEHYDEFGKWFNFHEGKYYLPEDSYVEWQKIYAIAYAKTKGVEVDEAELESTLREQFRKPAVIYPTQRYTLVCLKDVFDFVLYLS